MWAYILKRILAAIMLALAVASLVFISLYLIPGDPAEVLLSIDGAAPPPSAVEALRVQLGLDQPLLWQYVNFLGNLLQGDLGRSFSNNIPVSDTILARLPRTLELIAAATVISLIVGIPSGAFAAVRQGERVDRVLSFVTSAAMSIPIFVLGTGLIYVFAQRLHLVPAGGYISFSQDPARHMLLLLMPAIALSFGFSATVFRMTRASVATVLTMDWVRTARAKGVGEQRVMRRHVVRNALVPVATVVGLEMGGLLGGTVLTEFVFNWPGLSSYLITAIENRDYPPIRGTVLVIALLFILLNLLVDLLYMFLDPRVRH